MTSRLRFADERPSMTRIAICAPATRITRDHAAAFDRLLAADFPQHSAIFHEQCFAAHGHFAGTDLERLNALVECANDPDYDAVWFAKGGYGSNRIAQAAIVRMNDACADENLCRVFRLRLSAGRALPSRHRAACAWADAGQRAQRIGPRGGVARAALVFR